ncbi:hypothetical protein MGG_17124 [Pyricularia oryzae 70-15]|uniref:Uncharacterized protein n=1 Tax=Pyricularia oryzae (strain 70-15 / ATCC MYA-4617 / FGSC 8958) TaxID=242507 RepID=G4N9I0_PYRO7|nr:uncharacterized protein MGG_17124 [Pyricularia oryzae 70-15]EHA50372.1 hypothetical protein MGG_17124 [Pyricularia oryzae 70-15]
MHGKTKQLIVGSIVCGDGPQCEMVGVGTKHMGTLRGTTVVALWDRPYTITTLDRMCFKVK